MPSNTEVKYKFKGWEQVKINLENQANLVTKIGIFSDHAKREEGELTNVEIGIKHEFGSFSEKIPRRSFLKEPLVLKRKELLKKIEKNIKANFDKVGGAERSAAILGVYAEAIVQEGFATGGYGRWKPLSPKTVAIKGNSQILIDTSQLRKSIISKVEKR